MFRKNFIAMMILLVALVAINSNAFAQMKPGDRAGAAADMLYRKLHLTNDQYMKVYPAFLDYYTKNSSGKSDANWETVKNSMSSTLTKDQMAEYTTMNFNPMSTSSMMKRHHKRMMKSTDNTTKDMSKDNTKKMDDTKKDGTKKMDDTKKDATKKMDDTKKDMNKKTDKK